VIHFCPGLFNVINDIGQITSTALVVHPGVDRIAFTGHVDTAKIIQEATADTLKRTSFGLGGKSPNVMFAGADMDRRGSDATFHII
jgi:aldehyde dehydrogenase (NAD+)